jgi:hypothetical protein
MSCGVVRTRHLQSPITHNRYSTGEQRLTGRAPRRGVQLAVTPGRTGLDFIVSEPEAVT